MNTYLLVTIITIPIAVILGFIAALLAVPKIKENKLYKGLIKLSDENLQLKLENVELQLKIQKLEKEKLN